MMKNFEKKETNLNQLIEKLGKLNTSYSQHSFDNKSIEREKNLIKIEKDERIILHIQETAMKLLSHLKLLDHQLLLAF